MTRLKRVESLEFSRFEGYINAAQHIFLKGELEVFLESALFQITDRAVTDEDVIRNTYSDFEPIEYRSESTVEDLITKVNTLLTITTGYWKPEYSVAEHIEAKLREGYWEQLNSCFNYRDARVVELGDDVPYVNIDGGFTYILYAPDMSRCILLVGNTSD